MKAAIIMFSVSLIVGITGAYSAWEMAERAATQARQIEWLVIVGLNVLQAISSGFILLLLNGKDEPEE